MTVLLRLFAVALVLVGLLAGGCSLVFTAFSLQDFRAFLNGGGVIFAICLAGFGIAAFFIWAGISLWRSRD